MKRFFIPLLLALALFAAPTRSLAAIAFDSCVTASSVGSPTSPYTQAFTNTAGNVVFIGVVSRNTGDVVTAASYGGTAGTLVQKVNTDGTVWSYIYKVPNAPTGTNNISVSFTLSSVDLRVGAASYSGMDIGTSVDNSKTGSFAAVSSVTTALTTVADNSWVIIWNWNETANNVAGTGSTQRCGSNNPTFFDSNGPVTPAGSFSQTVSWGSNTTGGYVQFSNAPLTAAVATFQLWPLSQF